MHYPIDIMNRAPGNYYVMGLVNLPFIPRVGDFIIFHGMTYQVHEVFYNLDMSSKITIAVNQR